VAELRTDKSSKNVPIVWQDYVLRMKGELKKIEGELKKVGCVNSAELRSRADRLRNDITLLK
jgi:hypothetical protein